MESDAPFAVEADEDARLRAARQASEYVSEATPLLPDGNAVLPAGAGSPDEDDASIHHKPWLGGDGFEEKPLWRRPSVSRPLRHPSELALIHVDLDMVVDPPSSTVYACFRGTGGAQVEPDPPPHLQGLLLRSGVQRSPVHASASHLW